MASREQEPDAEIDELVVRAVDGDRVALDELFGRHRGRLLRMVRLRLDRRVRNRIDESDVLQEALAEAWERLPRYLSDRRMPFFLWLRYLTSQKVLELHRRHLGAQARDVRREIRLQQRPLPQATSADLAERLMGRQTTPSLALAKAEQRQRLQETLERMDPLDREILGLRHYEQLSTREAAEELGIGQAAAAKRYVRALRRIRGMLGDESGERS
jgi:RNA polymerase sigma-70 factor (ECF subfamily)